MQGGVQRACNVKQYYVGTLTYMLITSLSSPLPCPETTQFLQSNTTGVVLNFAKIEATPLHVLCIL
jgi:hypothetical protein